MLRRIAATAACVLALDFFLAHSPVPGPTNASIVSQALASRSALKMPDEMFRLRVKHELLDAPVGAETMGPPKDQSRYNEAESSGDETLLQRAGHTAKSAIKAVQDFASFFGSPEPLIDPGLDMRPAPAVYAAMTREQTCNAIELAALEHKLPMEFFGRLIWQESRHNPVAISPAGARGIAQFMPATAADMKLQDPFDPVASLLKSAEFLRSLHDRFGNVGLAAAAYNGGAGRLERWLEKRIKNKKAALPKETQNYVRIITGKPVTDWVGVSGSKAAELKAGKPVPCVSSAKIVTASSRQGDRASAASSKPAGRRVASVK